MTTHYETIAQCEQKIKDIQNKLYAPGARETLEPEIYIGLQRKVIAECKLDIAKDILTHLIYNIQNPLGNEKWLKDYTEQARQFVKII